MYQEQLRQQTDPTHLSKKTLAKHLGVTVKSIKNFIKKQSIIPNKDGSIDTTTPLNKEFVENYQKYNTERHTRYTRKNLDKLQARLGKLPIEYCLRNGLIVAEKDGTVLTKKEPNKSFLEKIDNNEITHRTYFVTLKKIAEMLGIDHRKLSVFIKNGQIIKEKGLGVDLNNETNKTFISNFLK